MWIVIELKAIQSHQRFTVVARFGLLHAIFHGILWCPVIYFAITWNVETCRVLFMSSWVRSRKASYMPYSRRPSFVFKPFLWLWARIYWNNSSQLVQIVAGSVACHWYIALFYSFLPFRSGCIEYVELLTKCLVYMPPIKFWYRYVANTSLYSRSANYCSHPRGFTAARVAFFSV